jgi:NADH dehydrogenase (ubiquinone) Fe-S protein 1
VVHEELGWNGFNILHTEASRCGALDLGLSQKPAKDPKVVFIMGCDNIREEDIPQDAFVIY